MLNSTETEYSAFVLDDLQSKSFMELDLNSKVRLMNSVKTVESNFNYYKGLKIKPSDIFLKLTEWKYGIEGKEGEFPLFQPQNFDVKFSKGCIEEINESIDLLKLKKIYNQRIEEGRRNYEI